MRVRCSWVAGDEVYGASPELRALLHDRTIGYVLAAASNRRVPTAAGPMTVAQLAADTPTRSWQRLSAGAGTKGDRLYSWAWHTTTEDPGIGQCWVLVRRNDTTGELAFTAATALPGPIGCVGEGRRPTLDGRGIVPVQQRPDRPGPAPGPYLDFLAPLDDPGHARSRYLGDRHRRTTRPRNDQPVTDPVEYQRVSATTRSWCPSPPNAPSHVSWNGHCGGADISSERRSCHQNRRSQT